MRNGLGRAVRTPNAPRILLDGLDSGAQRHVIALALLVVVDLAIGREWDALDRIERAELSLEEKLAFGSLLNSQQASTLVSLREAAK